MFLCAKGGRGKIFHGKGKLLEAFTVKFTKIKTVLHLQTKKKIKELFIKITVIGITLKHKDRV